MYVDSEGMSLQKRARMASPGDVDAVKEAYEAGLSEQPYE
jgi:hypothetical protein